MLPLVVWLSIADRSQIALQQAKNVLSQVIDLQNLLIGVVPKGVDLVKSLIDLHPSFIGEAAKGYDLPRSLIDFVKSFIDRVPKEVLDVEFAIAPVANMADDFESFDQSAAARPVACVVFGVYDRQTFRVVLA